MPQFSIITVNYARIYQLEKLRVSLQNLQGYSWEWIIVDNYSSEREQHAVQHFASMAPHTHCIPLQRNCGFGQANNVGVQMAEGEYIVLVNPDIQLDTSTLPMLMAVLERSLLPHTIVCPVLDDADGKPLENAYSLPTFWEKVRRRVLRQYPHFSREGEVPITSVGWAQGSFLLLRRETFISLGGFDPQFFLFFEDIDLCRRCWQAGGQVLQVPSARATHGEHRLTGRDSIFTAMWKRVFWYHVLSGLKYFWKYRGQPNPPITPPQLCN
ncbi:glycosyltransferase family 2 protein [Candidatus Peribacteria bacterium]|nr:glycosyltransferase family 2 protein [Candidatus Peribacteria bacterium]